MSVKKIENLNKHENPSTNTNPFDIENYLNANWDTVKEVINNNADEIEQAQINISNLQEDNEINKTKISELETENEVLKNQIPKGQAEGENITLNDSAEMEFKELKVSGNSEQETRSGKNKFNVNAEKEILGLTYKYSYYLKPNTNYTISSNCPASVTANIYANSNSSSNAVYINKNQTIQSDENGYFYILVRFVPVSDDASTFNLYEKILDGTYYIQIEEGTVATDYEEYGAMPSPEFPSEIKNVTGSANITITNGLESTDANYQEQVINFPLSEGQRLMLGDYLADDGIHHKRGQYVFTGDENFGITQYGDNIRFGFSKSNIAYHGRDDICLSNYFSPDWLHVIGSPDLATQSCFFTYTNMIFFTITPDMNIANGDEFKTYLAEQYANGTPVVVEYELAEEVIEPYTEEQQIVYNQIKKATSYKNITHIFSTDEISPEFEVTYRKDLETLENNKEERLLALENAVLGGN